MLFQLLPTLQEILRRRPRGGRLLCVAAWWLAMSLLFPLVVVAVLALYRPNILGVFLDANAKGQAPRLLSRALDAAMKALGAMRGPDNPWRTLGVARGADMREIKKKVRELSLVRLSQRPLPSQGGGLLQDLSPCSCLVLPVVSCLNRFRPILASQMYHPDKTGNNPISAMKFLKIQARVESRIDHLLCFFPLSLKHHAQKQAALGCGKPAAPDPVASWSLSTLHPPGCR